MTIRFIFCFGLYLLSTFTIVAKNDEADSLKVVQTFTELITICKNVDFTDPKTVEVGMFYKAAPYIVYRGEDEARKWKDIANYMNPAEKKGVDEVCERINQSVNQDNNYNILQYFTESESEGTWHILMVSYIKKGSEKKAAFAFLKIGDRFALGDID
jgi:hypothetical protein